jgi:arylsulfatase A-like enzyme
MAERPNILFLMTDHTNAQATAPESQCKKPNLDRLASEGVRFARCYTTNAICSPARASLMTSMYPSTHGMWDCTHTQRPEWLDVPAERFTYFSQILAEAGYRMGYFGKWHVEQSNRLENFGWHEYDLASKRAARSRIPGSEVVVPKEGYRDYLLAAVSEDDEPTTHPAFDKGIDFIRRHLRAARTARHLASQPFCCFISTSEPHDAYIPPKRFYDLYDLARIRPSPTLRDEPTNKPEVIRRMRAVWQTLQDADWKRVSAAYWAVISFLDHEVGRVIEVLKETGLYDNTIIVFTCDHGDMMGGHGLATKGVGTSYEEVYNVPLILRVPGLTRGGEEPRVLTSLVDLAPTLLDLCGLEPLEGAQGKSLRPVLEGTADIAQWQDAYAEFFGQRFVYTQRITWHQEWKYVFSPGGIDELYNLAQDPHERVNLAQDEEHREVLLDMTKRMWRKMKEIGDESLFKSQYATLRTAPIGPGAIEET